MRSRYKVLIPFSNKYVRGLFFDTSYIPKSSPLKIINSDLIDKIITASTSQIVSLARGDYTVSVEYEYKRNKQLSEQSEWGQMLLVEDTYKNIHYFIALSAISAEGTRNGYVATKIVLPLRKYLNAAYHNKRMQLYLMDTESISSINDYQTFIYTITITAGIEIINKSSLPWDRYNSLEARENQILFNSGIHSIRELMKGRNTIRRRNSGNQSSYILEEVDSVYMYGKLFGNSQYEAIFLAYVISVLAGKEGKKFIYYQVLENGSEQLTAKNKQFLNNLGVIVVGEALESFYDATQESINEIRDQAKFKYNLLMKFNEVDDTGSRNEYKKCYLCSCDVQKLIIAAHIYRIKDIKDSELTPEEKSYCATTADNGLWLCATHDKLFEFGLIKFDHETGELQFDEEKLTKDQISFIKQITKNYKISTTHLTESTKHFIQKHSSRFIS